MPCPSEGKKGLNQSLHWADWKGRDACAGASQASLAAPALGLRPPEPTGLWGRKGQRQVRLKAPKMGEPRPGAWSGVPGWSTGQASRGQHKAVMGVGPECALDWQPRELTGLVPLASPLPLLPLHGHRPSQSQRPLPTVHMPGTRG